MTSTPAAWRAWSARPLLALGLLGVLAGCASSVPHPTAKTALPTASTGSLRLSSSYPAYQVSEPIGITVSDSGSATYYALDSYSSCTIIHLQRLVNGAWQDAMPCASGQTASVVAIAPASNIPYTFAPGDAPGNPNAWTPGIYRAALLVSTHSNATNPSIAAYSTGFRVGG